MNTAAGSTHECIDDAQLTARSKQLLRAYTAEYREAKRHAAIGRGGAFVLAVAGPLAALHSLEWSALVAALAGGWIFFTRLYLYPAKDTHVKLGARIQEKFDIGLFDLPWASVAGPEPPEEDIVDAAASVANDKRLTESIDEGWYATTAGLPWPVDVLFCQMASIAWGRRQHATYSRWLGAGIAAFAAFAVVIGLLARLSLADWLVTFLLPSLPALLDASELAIAQKAQSKNKEDLEQQARALWGTGALGSLTPAECREIQDEAFRLRSVGLQVPEFLYWRHRKHDEQVMREATELRRQQYRNAARSPSPPSPMTEEFHA